MADILDIPRDYQFPIFLIGKLGHAMVNLPAEFEVKIFSRYRDMKCVKNPQNGGALRWLGVIQGGGKYRHSIERIRLPIRLQ